MKKTIVFLLGFIFWIACAVANASTVNFTWGAPEEGQVDGYRIYYGDTEGGPYPEQLCEVNGTTLGYVAELSEDRPYYLICRAFNKYGESGDSNEVCWDYEVPGQPGNFIGKTNRLLVIIEAVK